MALSQTLRRGMKGQDVKELQKYLNNLTSINPKLKEDGDFGPSTENAVKQFQKQTNLTTDGIVGRKTWGALAVSTPKTKQEKNVYLPQAALADIAKQYIGVTETGDNLAGKSKELQAIFKADDLVSNGRTDGYPWCAAFVSFCVQKLVPRSAYYSGLRAPREASVNLFLNSWAKNNECIIFNNRSKDMTPEKGDIVVFTFSHIGIIEKVSGASITTIEGNTNEAGSREGKLVARKNRSKSLIKAYIRLPISMIKIHSRLEEMMAIC